MQRYRKPPSVSQIRWRHVCAIYPYDGDGVDYGCALCKPDRVYNISVHDVVHKGRHVICSRHARYLGIQNPPVPGFDWRDQYQMSAGLGVLEKINKEMNKWKAKNKAR